MSVLNSQKIQVRLEKPPIDFHAEIFRDCELRLFEGSKIKTVAKHATDFGYISYILNTINGITPSITINLYEGQAYLVIDGIQGFCNIDQMTYLEDFNEIREKLMLTANQVAYRII